MKYCVIYKKQHDEEYERTRFRSHVKAKKDSEFFSNLGFKTLILSKNDFEASYGPINKPKPAIRRVTNMSLLAKGFQNDPPFYNMDHHINIRGYIFVANKPRIAS